MPAESTTNAHVARMLSELADLLELAGESRYRARAYRRAAQAIDTLPVDLRRQLDAGTLQDIPGVGERIASHIAEYVNSGRLELYDDLRARLPAGLNRLLDVPGVGPATAARLYHQGGIGSLADLEAAARSGRLSQLPGFGGKRGQNLIEGLRHLRDSSRIPLAEALPLAEWVMAELQAALSQRGGLRNLTPAGSLRRRQETIGDIDLIGSADDPAAVVAAFVGLPDVVEILWQGPVKASVRLKVGRQIDLRLVPHANFGTLLHHFTGNRTHNIRLRTLAQARGIKISEYGLTDVATGIIRTCETEAEIYAAFDLQYIPPELREGTDELERAAAHTIPTLVEESDLRGDLAVCLADPPATDSAFDALAAVARQRGLAYLAVSNRVGPGGLTPDAWRAQAAAIRRWQAAQPAHSVRLLVGLEVDIAPDGALAAPEALLAEAEWLRAGVHDTWDQSVEVATARLLAALRHPRVQALAHPSGRAIGQREGLAVDWETLIAAAAETGAALEVHGNPYRLDLRDIYVRRAVEIGAPLVLGSGAATLAELADMRFAVGVARRGWAEAGHLLDTRPLAAILTWTQAQAGRQP